MVKNSAGFPIINLEISGHRVLHGKGKVQAVYTRWSMFVKENDVHMRALK